MPAWRLWQCGERAEHGAHRLMGDGGGASSWSVSDELRDGTSQFVRLVFRDEGVAVGYLDQPPVGEHPRQGSTFLMN